MSRVIGIFGGTFDPIHFGHLRPALELQERLGLAQVRLLPCGVPPHRGTPMVAAEHRLAMVARAVAGVPGLTVDDRELRRDGPSYMVDTLQSLRAELGETPLCLLLGADAFLGLHRWHLWQALPELAHLVIAHRPGWALAPAAMAPELAALMAGRQVDTAAALAAEPAGRLLLQPVTQLAISSTAIRELIEAGRSPRFLLPETVLEYIEQHTLYS